MSSALPEGLTIRERRNATRVTLRVSRIDGTVSVTTPPRFPERALRDFLDEKREWIATRRADAATPVPFAFGESLPYRGTMRQIMRGDAPGVQVAEDALHIGATDAALPALLERWLKARAREALQERTNHHAARIGVTINRLTLRDTRSRWGSCSGRGNLSFSWRLILAPDGLLNYLAAHEVAHLREMNHSGRFWAVVDDLCPDYERWERWLKANGAGLHRYGRGAART